MHTKITVIREFDTPEEAQRYLASSDPDPTPTWGECELVRLGHTIAGVKAYRTRTGAGLKDAIHAIDQAVPKDTRLHRAGGNAIEPTWTSADGKTQRLRDMATPYLRSVRRFAVAMAYNGPDGPGSGLRNAIEDELERRGGE